MFDVCGLRQVRRAEVRGFWGEGTGERGEGSTGVIGLFGVGFRHLY